eukprot:gene6115-12382_t
MKYYMRKLSKNIRKHSVRSDIVEDDIATDLSDLSKKMVIITCRSRQRLFSQAWDRWCKACGVDHDYVKDVSTILSRYIPSDTLRTELEIEILYKFMSLNHHKDPTGLGFTLLHCKKMATVVSALQQCRLERYEPGEVVLLQGELPRSEEGQYTVLSGDCEILQFPQDSSQ